MLKYNDLSKEERLILYCSKIDLSEDDERKVADLLKTGINFQKYLILAMKNKVLPLVSRHVMRLDYHDKIHFQYKRILDVFHGGNTEKNRLILKVFNEVITAFGKTDVKVVPLKGVILAPLVYKDLGLRTLGDIDFLISVHDKFKIPEIMQSLGFIQGYYDFTKEKIVKGPEDEINEWRDTDANLYPFVKQINDTTLKCVKIDFSFDVDKKQDYLATHKLLDSAQKREFNGVTPHLLDEIDFLIHIAIHLYKEATNVEWLEYHTDLNLIKFCDFREYMLHIIDNLDWDRLVERTKELDAEKPVYYCVHYIKYIYNDSFCDIFLDRMSHLETSFLDQYGELDYQNPKKWKKSFEERIFSLSNMDEITE